MEMSRTLDEYHEIADDIAKTMPAYATPNPYLTKEDFDEVIKRTDHAVRDENFTLRNDERWFILGLLEGMGFVRTLWESDDVKEIHLAHEYCETCRRKPGQPRSDNGLAAGKHCDACWEELKTSCRQRSW
jgi:hypothetical protein